MCAAIMIVGSVLYVAPARATTCFSGEQNTFVRHGGISTIWNSEGIWGENYIRDQALGSCPYPLERHSTVHIRSQYGDDWVEIGWFKEDDGSAPYWQGFAEWGIKVNGVDYDEGYRTFGSTCVLNDILEPDHWARFKTYYVSGTSPAQWNLYYDDANNGTYCFAGKFTDVTFSQGLNSGETGLTGGSDTIAYDHFPTMNYSAQGNDTGWTAWQTNFWWQNCIPGWGRNWLANNAWEIQSGYSCPQ